MKTSISKVKAMNQTWFEKGYLEGLEKGCLEGLEISYLKGLEIGRIESKREMLKEFLEDRFGPLSPSVLERLEQMQLAELAKLIKGVWRATSLKELDLEN